MDMIRIKSARWIVAVGLGVELKVRTADWQDLFDELRSGKGDFIAASLTITPARRKLADFSNGYLTVQQRVIVHQSNYNLGEMEDLNGNHQAFLVPI